MCPGTLERNGVNINIKGSSSLHQDTLQGKPVFIIDDLHGGNGLTMYHLVGERFLRRTLGPDVTLALDSVDTLYTLIVVHLSNLFLMTIKPKLKRRHIL